MLNEPEMTPKHPADGTGNTITRHGRSVEDAGHRGAYQPLAPLYLRQGDTPRTFLWDILIAALPLYLFAIYLYGFRVLTIAVISVVFCMLTEGLLAWFFRHCITLTDGTACITGVLLSLLLPPSVPLWMPAAGAVFAIAAVKEPFRGSGRNLLNPAFAGYAFLSLFWNARISALPKPFVRLPVLAFRVDDSYLVQDQVLPALKDGKLPDLQLFQVFLGNKPGTVGAASALILIAVFLYLLIRKTVRPTASLACLAAAAAFCFLFPHLELASDTIAIRFTAYQLCSGSLLLAAFFMECDPASLPATFSGQAVFGLGCGILTMLLRYFGPDPDGAVWAVLVMNLLSPLLDRIFRLKHKRPKISTGILPNKECGTQE